MKMTIAYGPTPQGQKLYDFGFAKLTDKWLARKYQMPLPEVRQLKADVRKALKPKRKKRKAKPPPALERVR